MTKVVKHSEVKGGFIWKLMLFRILDLKRVISLLKREARLGYIVGWLILWKGVPQNSLDEQHVL